MTALLASFLVAVLLLEAADALAYRRAEKEFNDGR